MNEAALEAFYTRLAETSPIPVMLYNMPGNTGVNLSSALTLKLAAHPNIVGIKDSGGNIVQIAMDELLPICKASMVDHEPATCRAWRPGSGPKRSWRRWGSTGDES